MKLKRAITLAAITYVLSFIIGLASMFFISPGTELTELPVSYFIIGIAISIVLSAIFSSIYFKKVKPSAKQGFYFGLVLIAVGFILDVVIFFLGSLSSEPAVSMADYYSNIFFWIALVLLLVTTTVVGYVKGRK